MVIIGTPMALAWVLFGGRGLIFIAGGFIALFGGYMLWTDFLNPRRQRL
jgi:hypothetical protein